MHAVLFFFATPNMALIFISGIHSTEAIMQALACNAHTSFIIKTSERLARLINSLRTIRNLTNGNLVKKIYATN
jgi:hypothetical protein